VSELAYVWRRTRDAETDAPRSTKVGFGKDAQIRQVNGLRDIDRVAIEKARERERCAASETRLGRIEQTFNRDRRGPAQLGVAARSLVSKQTKVSVALNER
jgi:hypothetical protein